MPKVNLNLGGMKAAAKPDMDTIAAEAPLKQFSEADKKERMRNISITMRQSDLDTLDALAQKGGLGRSAFLRLLLAEYAENHGMK